MAEYKYSDKPINRKIIRLQVGNVIKCKEYNEKNEIVVRRYTITKVYPYFAMGETKKKKKCFSIGDLVIAGIEPSEVFYD